MAGPHPEVLRVWTSNLLYRSHRPDLILPQITAAAPDVLLLQELTPQMAQALAAALQVSHPFSVVDPDPGPDGFGIFSRFPLYRVGLATLAGGSAYHQSARLDAHLGPIGLHNLHLVSPVDARAIRTLGRRGVGRLREAQASAVAECITAASVPAIAAGDLNAWPGRPAVRRLSNVAQDGWQVAGDGCGATWPNRTPVVNVPVPPLFRLDYCFLTAGLSAAAAHVVSASTGSDHCPVVVEVHAQPHLGRRPLGAKLASP